MKVLTRTQPSELISIRVDFKTPIVVALATAPHRFALLNDYLHTSLKCFKLRLRRINRAKPAIITTNPRPKTVVSMREAVINVSDNPTIGVNFYQS